MLYDLGPFLPYMVSKATIVPSPNGKGVILIGGWNSNINKQSKALLKLNGPTSEWIQF